MKITLPFIYQARVRMGRGGEEYRDYREEATFTISEVAADSAPIAVRWKGSELQKGLRDRKLLPVRVYGGIAYEPLCNVSQVIYHSGAYTTFVKDRVTKADFTKSDASVLRHIVTDASPPASLSKAETVKRRPPRSEVVVHSDREDEIESISKWLAEHLLFIEGELFCASALPIIVVNYSAVEKTFMPSVVPARGGSDWLHAFQVTDFESAREMAHRLAVSNHCPVDPIPTTLEMVEVVDSALATFDIRTLADHARDAALRKAIVHLSLHMPKGTHASARIFQELRDRWPRYGQEMANPSVEDDLPLLRRAAEILKAENGSESQDFSIEIERLASLVADEQLAELDLK